MHEILQYLTFKNCLFAAFLASYVALLWQFLYHGQWKMALLSFAFLFACGGGFIIALIIGWQEAAKWQMKRLMIVYSLLLVPCVFVGIRDQIDQVMHPKIEEPAKGKKKKAPIPVTR